MQADNTQQNLQPDSATTWGQTSAANEGEAWNQWGAKSGPKKSIWGSNLTNDDSSHNKSDPRWAPGVPSNVQLSAQAPGEQSGGETGRQRGWDDPPRGRPVSKPTQPADQGGRGGPARPPRDSQNVSGWGPSTSSQNGWDTTAATPAGEASNHVTKAGDNGGWAAPAKPKKGNQPAAGWGSSNASSQSGWGNPAADTAARYSEPAMGDRGWGVPVNPHTANQAASGWGSSNASSQSGWGNPPAESAANEDNAGWAPTPNIFIQEDRPFKWKSDLTASDLGWQSQVKPASPRSPPDMWRGAPTSQGQDVAFLKPSGIGSDKSRNPVRGGPAHIQDASARHSHTNGIYNQPPGDYPLFICQILDQQIG